MDSPPVPLEPLRYVFLVELHQAADLRVGDAAELDEVAKMPSADVESLAQVLSPDELLEGGAL